METRVEVERQSDLLTRLKEEEPTTAEKEEKFADVSRPLSDCAMAGWTVTKTGCAKSDDRDLLASSLCNQLDELNFAPAMGAQRMGKRVMH